MYSRLQVAAVSVPPPTNADHIHRHVLGTWETARNADTMPIVDPCSQIQVPLYGAYIAASSKSFSKVFVDAGRANFGKAFEIN